MEGYITFGGEDEAFEFWKNQGNTKAWQEQETKEWLTAIIEF